MNIKTGYLLTAITCICFGLFGGPEIAGIGFVFGCLYFIAYFRYDANKKNEEEHRKRRLQQYENEQKEKDRLAAIRQEKWQLKNEKAKQARLRKQEEEDERAHKRQEFSYVYVLSNSSMPDILKIGYTDNNPISRANELSNSTGVPTPYRVIREYPFATPSRAKAEEKRLHSVFKKQRVNLKREFFRVSVEEVESKVRGYIKDTEPQPTTITPKPKVEAIRTETHTKEPEPSINELVDDMVERLLYIGIYRKKERPYLLPNAKNMLYSFLFSTMHNNGCTLKVYIDNKIRKLEFAGVFADEPQLHEKTSAYRYQCISCSRKFYTYKLAHGALPCPHCFKEYNIKGSLTK